MLKTGIDNRIRRDLPGQRLGRERYGYGASLEKARDRLIPDRMVKGAQFLLCLGSVDGVDAPS